MAASALCVSNPPFLTCRRVPSPALADVVLYVAVAVLCVAVCYESVCGWVLLPALVHGVLCAVAAVLYLSTRPFLTKGKSSRPRSWTFCCTWR